MDTEVLKEEGELSDSDGMCDEEPYNPVSRPYYGSSQAREVHSTISSSSDEDETSNSDSDSDSNSQVSHKKRKICPLPTLHIRNANSLPFEETAKKKNNIWANVIQEDELLSEIGGVKFKKIDSDRNVEAYDYSLALNEHRNDSCETFNEIEETEDYKAKKENRKKRFHLHRQDSNESNKGNSGDTQQKVKPRILRKLELKDDLTDEEVGLEIATALFEQKPELIIKVVQVLGREKALELYFETRKVEKSGGKMTLDGSRRRTSGGVFLFILRTSFSIERSQLAQIFCDDKSVQQSKQNRKRKRNKQKRSKKNNNEEAMDAADGEPMHLQKLFSSEDPEGTKCPGSTPVSTPAHSDQEDFDLSPNPRIRSNSVALPMKEVCEKAAFEISVREEAEKDVMDTC